MRLRVPALFKMIEAVSDQLSLIDPVYQAAVGAFFARRIDLLSNAPSTNE